MKFRHEYKHQIDAFDLQYLRPRLSAVMKQDAHAIDGKYKIRSLYFDNLYDKALREKIDGVNCREKFRIRYYNDDPSFLMLEKKSKINGLCSKSGTNLTMEEANSIVQGDLSALKDHPSPLVQELCYKMKSQGLMPKTIVDYVREPFLFSPGNVRVTLDYDIHTGIRCTDFLNPNCLMIPAKGAPIILEVKWDEFLPSIIRNLVQVPATRSAAFSKYAACRIYG